MKGIYRWGWDCRGGTVGGLFVADSDAVAAADGKEAYFGEILGKHSEVAGTLEAKEFKLISDDPSDVAVFERLQLTTGHNPFRAIAYADEIREEMEKEYRP